MEEHRTFFRLSEPFTLRFELGGDTHTARGKDLSGGGVRFQFAETIGLKQVLDVVLHLEEDAAPIRCQTQVVTCISNSEGGYDIGVHFLDLAPRDRDRLLTHIGQKRSRMVQEGNG